MKLFLSYFFVSVMLFFSACKDPEEVTPITDDPTLLDTNSYLKINIIANFAGDQFSCGERYNNINNYTVSIDNLKFYLSNLYAIDQNGDSVLLSEIELFDYIEGDTSFIAKVPKGNYQGITYSIGVPANLNSQSNPDFLISVYDENSPLSGLNGTFWGWQTGYRFFIFDGRYNLAPNSLEPNLDGFSIHTGNDTVFKTIDLVNAPFVINQSGKKDFTLNFDVSKFFYSEMDTIDLATENSYHGSLLSVDLAIQLTNNIANSIQHQP